MAITTLNNRSINRSDTASADQVWTATSATASDFQAVAGSTLVSEVATTSGSSVDLSTSIPAGTKMITVMFDGISTNSTGYIGIQIGDSGGFETSGYDGTVGGTLNTAANGLTYSSAFYVVDPVSAVSTYSGMAILRLQDSSNNTWCAMSVLGAENAASMDAAGGKKSLSAVLTQVRIISGDTLDAGAVSIQYA